jgi:hypothetical protein
MTRAQDWLKERNLLDAALHGHGKLPQLMEEFAAARCAQVEAQLEQSQGECSTIRRNYLHEKVEKEKAESEVTKLRKEIEIRQKVIHFGQYHQWATYDICQEKGCANTRKLTAPSREGDNGPK